MLGCQVGKFSKDDISAIDFTVNAFIQAKEVDFIATISTSMH